MSSIIWNWEAKTKRLSRLPADKSFFFWDKLLSVYRTRGLKWLCFWDDASCQSQKKRKHKRQNLIHVGLLYTQIISVPLLSPLREEKKANVERCCWYKKCFKNPPHCITHTETHSHTERKLIDKRRLTHVHTHTHTHTALRQPDREVYIISLGGQPEQTQSFNFHDSLSESERDRKKREREGKAKKQSMRTKRRRQERQTCLITLENMPLLSGGLIDRIDSKHFTNIKVKKSSENKRSFSPRQLQAASEQMPLLKREWSQFFVFLFPLPCLFAGTSMTVIAAKSRLCAAVTVAVKP